MSGLVATLRDMHQSTHLCRFWQILPKFAISETKHFIDHCVLKHILEIFFVRAELGVFSNNVLGFPHDFIHGKL